MSREFEVVVTEGMLDVAFGIGAREWEYDDVIRTALAHPDFRAQLRAWAAEEMRGLVAKKTTPDSYHSNERARARVWNACRAETLANITAWEKANENE